ncbi:MAG: DUF493 family protein [Crocinitomicaceae bacterium]|nr:DUF493 family protein [Crocinitomicaceae bacterium]
MSDPYKKLTEQLELLEWPNVFLFKFIVPNNSEATARVAALFDEATDLKFRPSKTGKYISVSAKEMMMDVGSIIEKYKKASEIEGLMAL